MCNVTEQVYFCDSLTDFKKETNKKPPLESHHRLLGVLKMMKSVIWQQTKKRKKKGNVYL